MNVFENEPRPAAVGGGLAPAFRDLETGGEIELGGGVFPVERSEDERDAYADAMQTGQERLDENCRS